MSLDQHTELEQQLATALKNRASGVEPADGSYVRLRQRVATEGLVQTPGSGEPRSRRSIAAVAAAVLLMLVGLGWWATRPPQTKIEAIDDGVPIVTTTMVTVPEIEDDDRSEVAVPEEPVVEAPTTTVAPREYEGAAFAGPRRATVEEASGAFLELIGVDHGGLEIDGLSTRVLGIDGQILGDLELEEAEVVKGQPGFQVVGMTSSPVSIASPIPGTTVTTSPLAIVGDARSATGSLGISLLSASDGSLLSGTTTSASVDQIAAFTAGLDVSGAAWAWLVVVDVGEDGQLLAVTAVPMSFIVDVDTLEYVVFDLATEAAGLDVRDVAGLEGAVVGTLPPGTTGVRRQGRVPELVDGEAWWFIEATVGDDAVVGWVDSRFLIEASVLAKRDVDETELIDLGRRLAEAGTSGDAEALAGLPWAPEQDIPFGWWRGQQTVPAAELATASFWESSREWSSPVDVGPATVTLSVLSFLDLPDIADVNIQYQIDGRPSPYGLDQQVISEQFPGVRSVTVVALDQTSDWRTVTLLVENTDDGPVIVGVGVTIWVP